MNLNPQHFGVALVLLFFMVFIFGCASEYEDELVKINANAAPSFEQEFAPKSYFNEKTGRISASNDYCSDDVIGMYNSIVYFVYFVNSYKDTEALNEQIQYLENKQIQYLENIIGTGNKLTEKYPDLNCEAKKASDFNELVQNNILRTEVITVNLSKINKTIQDYESRILETKNKIEALKQALKQGRESASNNFCSSDVINMYNNTLYDEQTVNVLVLGKPGVEALNIKIKYFGSLIVAGKTLIKKHPDLNCEAKEEKSTKRITANLSKIKEIIQGYISEIEALKQGRISASNDYCSSDVIIIHSNIVDFIRSYEGVEDLDEQIQDLENIIRAGNTLTERYPIFNCKIVKNGQKVTLDTSEIKKIIDEAKSILDAVRPSR